MNNAMGQTTPPPRVASTVHFNLFDEGNVLAARPTPLVEVRPQPGVQRHTAEQIGDVAPVVPALGVPEPQMVLQLVAVLKPVDSPAPEQIIAVPKISWPSRFPRTVLREPQKAEQLVEAPTLVSLVEVIEQPVDIPVRAWGGTGGRLQGFLPGQCSSSSVEEIADIPVPHHGIF